MFEGSLRKHAVLALMRLTGRDFRRELRTIESIMRGDIPLEDFVRDSLRSLLEHARKKVPHYSRLLRDLGDPLTYFDRIPVLKRSFVQAHVDDLTSTDMGRMKVLTGTTGGSTARPIRFFRDMRSYRWSKAAEVFYYSWFLGIDLLKAKKMIVWGSAAELLGGVSPLSRMIHFLDGAVYFNAYLIDQRLIERVLRKLEDYRPDILRGLSHFLASVAEYALKRGIDVYRPKAVISTGETLTGWRREVIEEAFGRVYNFYGAREAPSIAGECSNGSLHVFSFNNLVEILDDSGGRTPAGELGNIVVTPLHNYAMPLIRYEIGDMARAVDGRCSCGSILPRMGRIEGRTTEFVVRRDGSLLGGEFFEGIFRVEEWVRWNASKYPEGMPKGGQQGYIHHLDTSGMAVGKHELVVKMELVGASDPNTGNNEGKAVFTVVPAEKGSVEGIPFQLLIGVVAVAVILALVLLLRRR